MVEVTLAPLAFVKIRPVEEKLVEVALPSVVEASVRVRAVPSNSIRPLPKFNVEVPMPTAVEVVMVVVSGEYTVQFGSPGEQVGFRVSPGAYGVVGGLAKTGYKK